jgi:hypothetical protein
LTILAGCRSAPTPVEWAAPFPEDGVQRATMDIQVFRRVTTLSLTNSSTRAFGPSKVWVNQQFAKPIEGLAVGQSLELDLREFVNEHSETFRAGGFFAKDQPKKVSLVQLETQNATGTGNEILGLVIVVDELE